MSAVSSAALNLTSFTTITLVKIGNGEYTAASVSTDQKDANSLGLIKEADGNYGTTNPSAASSGSASAQSSSAVLSALASLKLGGIAARLAQQSSPPKARFWSCRSTHPMGWRGQNARDEDERRAWRQLLRGERYYLRPIFMVGLGLAAAFVVSLRLFRWRG